MPRFIKWLLSSLALLSPLFAQVAKAQTITAASCNSSDVLVALNSVTVDGTTVIIPAGTCTWTTRVAYTQVHSVTIKGAGNPTGSSSDGLNNPTGYNDQTIINDNVNDSNSSGRVFFVNTAAGKFFRMTGMSFLTVTGNTTNPFHGMVGIGGSSHSIRFDHNHIVPVVTGEGLAYGGWLYGTIDHNLFEIKTGSNNNLLELNGDGWNGVSENGLGDASWADSSHFGGQENVFIENNTFSGGTAFDCRFGGRGVFRYNTTTTNSAQTHGLGSDTRDRSCRMIEVYGNSSTHVTGQISGTYLDLEGGTYLIWGNTVTNFDRLVQGYNRRTNNGTYTQTPPPNGWGYCGNAFSGSTSVWDENLSNDGHFCIDGIGSGKGDLLTGGSGGSFTGTVDSVTGTQTWPHQAVEPVYSWGNSLPGLTSNYWTSNTDTTTTQNREYYLELPNHDNAATFNGTAGIGCGPSSGTGCANPVAQPATCTAGVGYWKPANKTLYICGSGNTWNAYYTPYTYPHPLVSSSNLTWGSMDAWLQMDTSTPGTTLIPTILTNGTVSGTSLTWQTCVGSGSCSGTITLAYTVGASQGDMGGSITVNGTTYPIGTTTQSLALAGSQNYTWAQATNFPNGKSQIVVNGYITLAASNTNVMDLIRVTDLLGNWVVMQQAPPATGFGVWMETGAPTTHSSGFIPMVAGKRYTFSLLADYVTGTSKLAVFDPANNFVQVDSTLTSTQPTGSTVAQLYVGNAEIGTASGTTYFENVMLDWTNHVFPNYPQASGTSPLAPPTNVTAVVQ